MLKLKIKAGQLREFSDFLMTLELAGYEGRMRTRLVKKLDKKLKEYNEEYREILAKHCHLDDEGNPRTKKKDGLLIYDLKEENKEEFDKDYLELWSEEYIVSQENDQKVLSSVRDSVLDCEIKFSGKDALLYDFWCELVENMEEDND